MVKAVSKKVARKALELVILFLEDWKENHLESTVEWVVDEQKCFNTFLTEICPSQRGECFKLLVNALDG